MQNIETGHSSTNTNTNSTNNTRHRGNKQKSGPGGSGGGKKSEVKVPIPSSKVPIKAEGNSSKQPQQQQQQQQHKQQQKKMCEPIPMEIDVDVDLDDIKINPNLYENGAGESVSAPRNGFSSNSNHTSSVSVSSSSSCEELSGSSGVEDHPSAVPNNIKISSKIKKPSATTTTTATNGPSSSSTTRGSGGGGNLQQQQAQHQYQNPQHRGRKGPFIKPSTMTSNSINNAKNAAVNHATTTTTTTTTSKNKSKPTAPSTTTTTTTTNPQQSTKPDPDCIDLTEENDGDDDDDISEISQIHEPSNLHRPPLQKASPQIIEEEVSSAQIGENFKKYGNELFKNGEYYKALENYSRAIAVTQNDPSYYGNRCACYLMLKKFKEAVNDAKQAILLDPKYDKVYQRLVRSLLALGDIKGCEAVLETITTQKINCDVRPEKQKMLHLKQLVAEVEASRQKKDHRRALYILERAIEIATGDVQLKLSRADCLFKLGRFTEAQEICTDTLQNDSMCIEAIYLRSLCLFQADNLDKAIQFIRQALQFSPDSQLYLQTYRKIKLLKEQREGGAQHFSAGRYNEAKGHYVQCLEILKTFDQSNSTIESKLQFNLALISFKLGQVDESLEHSHNAIKLNENYIKAILHRAGLHTRKELYDEAVRDYETVNRIDPKTKDIRRLLQESKMAAKRAKRKDYYKILGVDKNAGPDEIKKAYKKRALVHHPDRHASASEAVRKDQERQFKDLGEAYEILSDAKKKSRYDSGVDLQDSSDYSYEYDPTQIFQMFFQNGGQGQQRGHPSGGGGGFHQFRGGSGGFGFHH